MSAISERVRAAKKRRACVAPGALRPRLSGHSARRSRTAIRREHSLQGGDSGVGGSA